MCTVEDETTVCREKIGIGVWDSVEMINEENEF